MQVWSTKQPAAVTAIDLRANVCCAKYNPACAHEIAVGCADHNVHLYDLRNAARPVHVFTGTYTASKAQFWYRLRAEGLKTRKYPVKQ